MRRYSSVWLLLACLAGELSAVPGSVVQVFAGPEFEGGAKDVVGVSFLGEEVNTIYARPTGQRAIMQTGFTLQQLPPAGQFIHLKGRDDDSPKQCDISIKLNDTVVFEGPNPFPAEQFGIRKFPVPQNAFVVGTNRLLLACREQAGQVGQPPWFQVASCVIAPESYVLVPDLRKNFQVVLPAEKREFPEPLLAGREPGFKFRGTKGWAWTPEQYLEEIPWLKRFKLNFLMNCYVSMFDIEHHVNWADGEANRWWEDLPAPKKAAYERVVRAAQEAGIEFCFGMNPNLTSKRFISADNPESIDQLYKHYAWMQSLGVKWFNISLDDITQGIDAGSHARVVNTVLQRLRAKDPSAKMIFCPTYYWADGTGEKQRPYLETLARELDPEVYLFWTGDAVVGRITRQAAETFRRISAHKLFLWDNYPVNDDHQAMHLGPVIDRDADLCSVVEGYMGNPHRRQNQINRIPLATCADYAYNPGAYDPSRSIGQAILQVAETRAQQEVLRDCVEAYPGMLIWSPPARGTGFNCVQEQFNRIMALSHSRQAALAFIEHVRNLEARLKNGFPDGMIAERETLHRDLQAMEKKFKAKYP